MTTAPKGAAATPAAPLTAADILADKRAQRAQQAQVPVEGTLRLIAEVQLSPAFLEAQADLRDLAALLPEGHQIKTMVANQLQVCEGVRQLANAAVAALPPAAA